MLFTEARVLDGTLDPPRDRLSVLVQGDTIVKVGKFAAQGPALPGYTLLPGFIDCHVHLGLSSPARELKGGVTVVRDLGWSPSLLKAPPRDGPLVLAVGPILTAPGGYPGRAGWCPRDTAREVTADNAAVAVRELARAGACAIKVALEPRAGPTLDRDVLRQIVQTAHASKLKVTAHVSTLSELTKALEADVDELAHGLFDDTLIPDPVLQRMVKARMALVPTLHIGPGENRLANVRRFHAAGGRLLFGTDLGNYGTAPGIDTTELELMVQAGLTPLQAIHCATGGAAAWLGLKRRGTLAPGQLADLVVIKGDPLKDLSLLARPERVYKSGVIVR